MSYRGGFYNSWNGTGKTLIGGTSGTKPQLVAVGAEILAVRRRVIGAVRYFNEDDSNQLRIELLSDDAVKTLEIEGEYLDRISVQSPL